MKKRQTELISDKKKRGEWVELKFMAEAAEGDLQACKPLGDSENFDVVVGRPGKFVGVQVKCTVFRSKNGEGYICSTCSSHNVYREGAFEIPTLNSATNAEFRMGHPVCGAGEGVVHPAGGGDPGKAVGVIGGADE